jgi:hypothetical protein
MTLFEFKELFESYGEAPSSDRLEVLDSVLKFYRDRLGHNHREVFGAHTLDTLLDEFPAPNPAVRA